MENQKDPLLTPEDNLHAENNLLKLKLGVEHDMHMEDLSTLSPELQNEWLKSVYSFEQKFRDAKTVKLYEYIGRPTFPKCNTLTPDETRTELQRIELIMENHGVELDRICKYDDAIIYKFITEELFEHEVDDLRLTGMTWHFIYEEFHPNHDHDLRQHTSRFINAVFTRPWDEEFDGMNLAQKISFSGNDHDRRSISSIMKTFQEAHTSVAVEDLTINEVMIDPTVTRADVSATLSASGKMRHGNKVRYAGLCRLHFIRLDDYWCIEKFQIPGLAKAE